MFGKLFLLFKTKGMNYSNSKFINICFINLLIYVSLAYLYLNNKKKLL